MDNPRPMKGAEAARITADGRAGDRPAQAFPGTNAAARASAKKLWPLLLFLVTCIRRTMRRATYALAVMTILLAHEMGISCSRCATRSRQPAVFIPLLA